MTTRELIEAVRHPASLISALEADGRLVELVRRAEFDALRAATLAVLDECIEAMTSAATWRQVFDARANARALREKLK